MMEDDRRRTDRLLRQAQEAAQNYAGATGLDCYVIDVYGNPLDHPEKQSLRCGFCREFHRLTGKAIPCRRVQLYGAYQAEIYGGKYIYFCPTSLLHWTTPLVYKGLMAGALVAGPALLVDPEDILTIDFPGKYPLGEEQKKAVLQVLEQLPRLDPERARQLSELLALTGQGLTVPLDQQQRIYREKASQQSSIGAYIQKLKQGQGDLSPSAYPLEKEENLLKAIRNGDKELAEELLNEILGHIYFTEGQNFEKIRNSGIELTVLLSRAALKGGASNDQVWALKHTYVKKIQETTNSLELTYQLDQLMRLFMDQLFNLKDVKHADAIFRSLQYIRTHFAQPITLGDVAREAYLSDSYFSTIFKEEVGEAFKNYLNRFRVEKSKALLRESGMTIGDIAQLCGFEEQSYYTRVFRKITGTTPKDFREKRR